MGATNESSPQEMQLCLGLDQELRFAPGRASKFWEEVGTQLSFFALDRYYPSYLPKGQNTGFK